MLDSSALAVHMNESVIKEEKLLVAANGISVIAHGVQAHESKLYEEEWGRLGVRKISSLPQILLPLEPIRTPSRALEKSLALLQLHTLEAIALSLTLNLLVVGSFPLCYTENILFTKKKITSKASRCIMIFGVYVQLSSGRDAYTHIPILALSRLVFFRSIVYDFSLFFLTSRRSIFFFFCVRLLLCDIIFIGSFHFV